jgi:hypothetical protein
MEIVRPVLNPWGKQRTQAVKALSFAKAKFSENWSRDAKFVLMSAWALFVLRQCLLFPALLSHGSELLHDFVQPIQPKLMLDFCFAAVIRPALPK